MRVMAVRTFHLAFADGMMRLSQYLTFNPGMTFKTQIIGRYFIFIGIGDSLIQVYFMTVCT